MTNKVTGETRRQAGRDHFTAVLGYLLQDVSHPEMANLADWACNEAGNLHTSQISHLRNAKMRMLGVKSLDALGRINTAAYLFQTDRQGAFRKCDVGTTTAKIEEILKRYRCVLHSETGEPLGCGGLMELYLGYITIPDLSVTDSDDDQLVKDAAAALPKWFDLLLDEIGMKLRDAIALAKANWQGNDDQLDQFCKVIAGMEDYKGEELRGALPYIAVVVSKLMDEDVNPTDLLEMVTGK